MAARPSHLTRGVLLASIAAFLGIAWLAREFEIDTGDLVDFFITSVGFVAGIALLAALAAAVIAFFRR